MCLRQWPNEKRNSRASMPYSAVAAIGIGPNGLKWPELQNAMRTLSPLALITLEAKILRLLLMILCPDSSINQMYTVLQIEKRLLLKLYNRQASKHLSSSQAKGTKPTKK